MFFVLALFRSMNFFSISAARIRNGKSRQRVSERLFLGLLLVIFGTFFSLAPQKGDRSGDSGLWELEQDSPVRIFLSSSIDLHPNPEETLPCLQHRLSGQSLTCPGNAGSLVPLPGVPADLTDRNSSIEWPGPPKAWATFPDRPQSSAATLALFDPPPRESSVRTKKERRPDFTDFLRRTRWTTF